MIIFIRPIHITSVKKHWINKFTQIRTLIIEITWLDNDINH